MRTKEALYQERDKLKDELIKHLRLFALTNSTAPFPKPWNKKRTDLESKIASLTEQISKEAEQPEEAILVDDPHYPNIGRKITRKEYENQFQSPSEQPEVTDRMIEEWASIGSSDIKHDFTSGAKSFMRGVIFGAKAMRDGEIFKLQKK